MTYFSAVCYNLSIFGHQSARGGRGSALSILAHRKALKTHTHLQLHIAVQGNCYV